MGKSSEMLFPERFVAVRYLPHMLADGEIPRSPSSALMARSTTQTGWADQEQCTDLSHLSVTLADVEREASQVLEVLLPPDVFRSKDLGTDAGL